MDQTDLLLALKDLLNDTNGKLVISHLINFPLILNFLENREKLKKIADVLGNNSQFWTLTNLFKLSTSLQEEKYLKDAILPFTQEIKNRQGCFFVKDLFGKNDIYSLSQIIEKINKLKESYSWEEVFLKIGLEDYSNNDENKSLETIFSAILENEETKKEFITSLLAFSKNQIGPKLMAQLSLLNKPLADYLRDQLRDIFSGNLVDFFINFVQELMSLGEMEGGRQIVGTYLEDFPFSFEHFCNDCNDDLMQMQYLKKYAILFSIAGSESELARLSSMANEILESIENKFFNLQRITDQNNQITLNTEIVFDENNNDTDLVKSIKKLLQVLKSDEKTAILLAESIFAEISSGKILIESLRNKDFGFFISPSAFIEIFIDLGLYNRAQSLLRIAITKWPGDIFLKRLGANFSHDHGNHQAANNYFLKLELSNELSREEKRKFAKSLEYCDRWEAALLAREKINNINLEDQIDKIICAFHAGRYEIFDQLIDRKVELSYPLLCQVIRSVSNNSSMDIQTLGEEIIKAITSGKMDRDGVYLGANYLQKLGENERAISILESYQINFGNNLEQLNLLFSLYKKVGNKDMCGRLSDVEIKDFHSEQKPFEDFIENLLANKDYEKAERALNFATDKWRLSPRKIELFTKILIEKKQFGFAKLLLSNARNDYINDPDIIFDFCLASLNCRFSDFPIGLEQKEPEKQEHLKNLFLPIHKKDSLLHELLMTELINENKVDAYKSLLKKYSTNNEQDIWRIHAGIGKFYFLQKQFDLAIVNFKAAQNIEAENELIENLLIKSYMALGLWDEIENLFSSNFVTGKQIVNVFFDENWNNSKSNDLIKFVQRQVQCDPENVTLRIMLSQIMSKIGKKEESSAIIKDVLSKISFDDENYLLCLQALVDAGEWSLAERSAEIFLVNKKNSEANDYLSIAFVFDQLDKPDKSISVLNHLDTMDSSLLIYKSQLRNRLNEFGEAESLISAAYDLINMPDLDFSNIKVNIPEIISEIRHFPEKLFSIFSLFEIKKKGISAAISILIDGLSRNFESEIILLELLSLLNVSGDIQKINSFINSCNNIIDHLTSPMLACQLGEIALSQKEEIKAANYLSQALEFSPNHPRVKALQARLVAKNGNFEEARKIIGTLDLDKIIGESVVIDFYRSSDECGKVNSLLWLANALNDLEDYDHALNICMAEIENFGLFTPLALCFLTALDPILENEIISKSIKVDCQSNIISEKEISIFKEIVEFAKSGNAVGEVIPEKLLKCQIFLNDCDSFNRIEEINKNFNNINVILYGTYMSKGKESAEILFNSFKTAASHNIFMAVLEKDDDPQLALSHIKRAMQQTVADDVTYALLAIIENNIGNYSDALAAISLALEKSPFECNWLIMAGELSEKTGDIRTALSFYERANDRNPFIGQNKDIDSLVINVGDERAIAILEKQLSKKISKEKLLELGIILMKHSDYRKATSIFDEFAREYPDETTPYLWLAEISLRHNNLTKALEFTDKGLSLDSKEQKLVCLKARLIKQLEGTEKAILFAEQKLEEIQYKNPNLVLIIAEFLAESKGNQPALEFLNSLENLKDNPIALLEKARMELRMGNLNSAEKIAEKMLGEKDLASDSLSIMGEISKLKGELDRAIDFHIKAIDLKPFITENFSKLADIYDSMNESNKAIETLEEGLKINVGDFNLFYKASLYYYQHGLYSQAKQSIKKAIKINPGHKDARNIMNLLEKF